MNAKQKIHYAKLNQRIGLFKEQADSGLTVKQWCEENNYSIHTYNYWNSNKEPYRLHMINLYNTLKCDLTKSFMSNIRSCFNKRFSYSSSDIFESESSAS